MEIAASDFELKATWRAWQQILSRREKNYL